MAAEPRVVVITGASSGIGRATAHTFAARGERLVLVARRDDALAQVATECEHVGAAETLTIACDVTAPDALIAVVEAALARFGRVDVWVGNASVFGYGTLTAMPRASFARILEVSLVAQIEGVRAVLPHFLSRGSGAIVLVGSLYSRVAAPYLSAYVTAKHGLLGFAESVRHEVRRAGIAVSTVLPATVDTPIYQSAANHTGARVHPLPPVVHPRRVARVIERRSRHPRPTTQVGVVQGAGWPVSLVARPLYGAVIRTAQRRLALRGRADPTDGALFRPPEGTGSVTGGWRSTP